MTRFEFDPVASLMSLEGRSNMHPFRAETAGLQGWIEADIAAASGQAAVTSGYLSIPLESLSAHNPLYDAELRRRIDIRRYPTMDGVLTEWRATSQPGRYRVKGNVSFRGIQCEAEDDMTLSVSDAGTLVLDGWRIFDVRNFGIEPPHLLGVRVHPEVTIRVAVAARLVE